MIAQWAAPIAWAIVNGETRTGLTTMRIDAGMDTGPVLLKYETEIGPDETAPELMQRMSEAGAPLVAESLVKLDRGEITAQAQDNGQATMAPMLTKEAGRIDWSRTAGQIYNQIRGLAPWPGAYSSFRGQLCLGTSGGALPKRHQPRRLVSPRVPLSQTRRSTRSAAAGTALAVEAVQLEGRKRITAREFANGARLTPARSIRLLVRSIRSHRNAAPLSAANFISGARHTGRFCACWG